MSFKLSVFGLALFCVTCCTGMASHRLHASPVAIIENCGVNFEDHSSCYACHDKRRLPAGECFIVLQGLERYDAVVNPPPPPSASAWGAVYGVMQRAIFALGGLNSPNPPPRPQVSITTQCMPDGSVKVTQYTNKASDPPCQGSTTVSQVEKHQCVTVDSFENDGWGYKFLGCV